MGTGADARLEQWVLIGEDDPQLVGALAEALEDEGYEVSVATGSQVLALAADDPPGIILLDVIMPGMHGLQVCRRLKADPRTRAVPVLLVTALSREALAELDPGCPFDGHLRKPFALADLFAAVGRYLPVP